MAIIVTQETIGGRAFTYTRSDAGYYIKQDSTDLVFEEAYDLVEYPQTYTETDEKIDEDPEGDYAEAGKILLGEVE